MLGAAESARSEGQHRQREQRPAPARDATKSKQQAPGQAPRFTKHGYFTRKGTPPIAFSIVFTRRAGRLKKKFKFLCMVDNGRGTTKCAMKPIRRGTSSYIMRLTLSGTILRGK